MNQDFAEKIRAVVTDPTLDTSRNLHELAEQTRVDLWHQLANHQSADLAGKMTLGTMHVLERLADVTLLIGPEPARGKVPLPLIAYGTYEAFHDALGIATDLNDEVRTIAAAYMRDKP